MPFTEGTRLPTLQETATELVTSPDLEPMHQLEARAYNCVINDMTNLVISVISMLVQVDQEETAQTVSKVASTILADYDPDGDG